MSESSHWIDTSKTIFFREAPHFSFLAETVVYDLKAGASLGRAQQVRIWSAACSTGEEPYSIAISLLEALRDPSSSPLAMCHPGGWRIEVVASDVDTEALAIANEGTYSEDSLAALPDNVKKRYFLRGRGEMAGQVRVKHALAELVHFQHVDLESIHWAVEGPFDVIFLRNRLGSIDRRTLELCLRTMLRLLNPHGYLILDPSERVPWLRDAVAPIGKGIYQLRPHGKALYAGRERRNKSRERRPLKP